MGRPGADGGHHGLFHQVHFAGFGAIGGIDDGALFHLRDFAGNADDDARMHQHLAAVRLLNEVVQHALGDFEVGDDAVLHGPDGDDVAGRAAQHFLGFLADGLHFAVVLVDGDDGGLVDDDAFPLAKTSVLAVPRSMARSDEKRLNSDRMFIAETTHSYLSREKSRRGGGNGLSLEFNSRVTHRAPVVPDK